MYLEKRRTEQLVVNQSWSDPRLPRLEALLRTPSSRVPYDVIQFGHLQHTCVPQLVQCSDTTRSNDRTTEQTHHHHSQHDFGFFTLQLATCMQSSARACTRQATLQADHAVHCWVRRTCMATTCFFSLFFFVFLLKFSRAGKPAGVSPARTEPWL
ncbi:hypothetical protein L209DRAFT_597878 [Thermothelomyces heterothallicus CBS 203.75]